MRQTYKNDDGEYVQRDVYNGFVVIETIIPNTDGMLVPVRCTLCNKVYDLTSVTPLARYAYFTTFESPCCHKHVDDRTWKGMPDIERLTK